MTGSETASTTLLLCYDGSDDARTAITTAATLVPGADAVVLHVSKSKIDWSLGPSLGPLLEMPDVDQAILEQATKVLADGVDHARAAGLQATGELRTTGSAVWRSILDVAHARPPRLVVAGSHGHRLRNRLPLGSVAQGLVASADVPVMITHRSHAPARREATRLQVLAGYDGSANADAAIDVIAGLFPDVTVQVTSIWEPPAHLGEVFPTISYAPYVATLEQDVEREAVDIAWRGVDRARRLGLDAEPVVDSTRDGIGATLVEMAHASGADLLCVGTHGHARVTRSLLGSTASWIVQHADIPVIVVPSSMDTRLLRDELSQE